MREAAMREKESTKSNPKPKPEARVLSDDELDSVSGGKVQPKDFDFVHKVDKASPVLI
jgi:bacteriocin-like protein